MDVRFEDHDQFRRAAGLAALGGGALAAVVPLALLLPAAVVGSALAVALQPGLSGAARKRRFAAALFCAVPATALVYQPLAGWLLPICGAMLGILFALARRDTSLDGEKAGWAMALAAALGACAVVLGALVLPSLASALALLLPDWISRAASGAACGLWAGLAAVPLHIAVGADPAEAKLAALRMTLPAEVRALAERAVSARRAALGELSPGMRGDLRGVLDELALAALDLAARAGSLSRAAAPSLLDELQRRSAQLLKSAAAAEDPAAKESYQRAADASSGQLEHFHRVRRARERVLARLHEDVANLERARFSLTLLRGAGPESVELDLLHDRLAHGALAFEAEEELAAPGVVVSLRA